MAGVASVRSRIDTHCTVFITAQRKKQRLHLRKSVRAAPRAHALASRARIDVNATRASACQCVRHHTKRARTKSCDETMISCACDDTVASRARRKIENADANFAARNTSNDADLGSEKFCTGSVLRATANAESIKNERIAPFRFAVCRSAERCVRS